MRCIDTYGDGWNGGYLLIEEKKHCEDFKTGHLKTEQFSWAGENSFNFDSTGGFSGSYRDSSKPSGVSEERRGGDVVSTVKGSATNTDNDGNAVDQK